MVRTRSALAALVAVGSLTWAGTSHAFDPIAFAETPSLVGKPVYAATNQSLGHDKPVVFAGDALTLVEAKPFGNQGFNYVKVRTKEGAEGELQIRFLSKTPLKYSLRAPGTPKAFLKALLEDAYPLGAKMHAIREKHGYDVRSDKALDDYHMVDAMNESFTFTRAILHGMVHGAHRSEADLLREDRTKWLGADTTLLTWYADGMGEKDGKQVFVNAVRALNALDAVREHGFQMARATTEKNEKRWLVGLEDAPAPARAKIDKEKTQELDKDIAERKKKMAASFAEAAKLKSQVK